MFFFAIDRPTALYVSYYCTEYGSPFPEEISVLDNKRERTLLYIEAYQ
jgi:hypothetical protein